MSAQTNLFDEIIVDGFAGGGGWSWGIEQATGHPVDIAINHDPDAILMHKTNHPYTKHYCESIYEVDPVKAVAGLHRQGVPQKQAGCLLRQRRAAAIRRGTGAGQLARAVQRRTH